MGLLKVVFVLKAYAQWFFFFLSSHFIKREMHIHNKLGSEAYKSDIQIALFTGNSLRPS